MSAETVPTYVEDGRPCAALLEFPDGEAYEHAARVHDSLIDALTRAAECAA